MTKKGKGKGKAVEEVVVEETVIIPFNSPFDAFQKAAVEKQEAEKATIKAAGKEKSFLTAEQVESIEVNILSPEELAAAVKETGERKNAAQALGGKLAQLCAALEQIYSIPNWEITPRFQEAASSYEEQIENLQSQGDKDFQEQVKVALLFAKIHTTAAIAATKENIYDLMNQIANQGRGNLCHTESFPKKENGRRDYGPNAVVFKEYVLVPANGSLDKNGRQSKTDHGLFTALRRLIEHHYSEFEKEQEKKIALVLSSKAEEDLEPLLSRKVKLAEKVGVYRINLPEKRENGKLYRAGAAIFEVGFRGTGENPFLAVEVKNGAGSLSDFEEMKGFWFDFGMLFAKELSEKITGKRRENVERFVRVFRAATYGLRKAYYDAKQEKPKPKVKKAKS